MEPIVHRASLNLGGNSEIFVIRHSHILNHPRIVNGEVSDDLLIAEDWKRVDVVPYSIKYKEDESDRSPGVSLDVSIEFVIAQETADVKAKMKLLRQERLALLVKDNSTGKTRLIGNKNEYVKHSRRFDTGGVPSDLNANKVSLSGKLVEVPFLTGESLVAGPPAQATEVLADVFSATENRLTWTDNSDDETSFIIMRAESSEGPWTQIAELDPDITEYIDDIS